MLFSSTLTTVDWRGAKLVPGDAVPAVRAMKEQDLVVYGFGRLGHALLAADLVDVLNLAVHPVVLGAGEQVFRPGSGTRLQLSDVDRRATGVVSLTYTRSR